MAWIIYRVKAKISLRWFEARDAHARHIIELLWGDTVSIYFLQGTSTVEHYTHSRVLAYNRA